MELFIEIILFLCIFVASFVGVRWWYLKQRYKYDEDKLPKKITHWEPDADPEKVRRIEEMSKRSSGRYF